MERQSDDDKDRDWLLYIRAVLVRTGISSAAMFVIYLMESEIRNHFVEQFIGAGIAGKLVSAGLITGFMIPFAAIINGSGKDALMMKLWLKHRANRLPILTLKGIRVMLSACFIALVLRKIFHIPYGLIVLIAAIPAAIIVHSDYVKGKTIDLEMRFVLIFRKKHWQKRKKSGGSKETMSGSTNLFWLQNSR